jgi:hypothetical protein
VVRFGPFSPEPDLVDTSAPAQEQATVTAPRAVARSRIRRSLPDVVALAGVFAAFFAVNDAALWVSAGYFQDEAWTALSTRVPLGDLPTVTSSTPIGWSLLLRLIPDPDALRLLPLTFALIAVVAAYALGRLLPWRSQAESLFAGLVCATAVVLLPAEQMRHDLKQYTADAAVTLVLLAMTTWLNRAWSRRRVTALAAVAPVAFLLSQITLIVVAAVFAGLLVSAALRRDLRRFIDAAAAGAASGLVQVLMYLLLVAPNRSPALVNWWRADYPTLRQLPGYLHSQLRTLDPSMGFHHLLIVLALVVAGVVVLVVQRQFATAVTVVVLPALLVVLGVARMYPLLDQRTSYFLFAAGAAVAGIAMAGSAVGLARAILRRSAQTWQIACSAALVLLAFSVFVVNNQEWYRFDGSDPRVPDVSPIARVDVRTQVHWVDAHRTPGDVVVVSKWARYGYVFYHDEQPLTWRKTGANTIGWEPVITDPDVIGVTGDTAPAIQDAVNRAVARARSNGPNARLLLIRTWRPAEVNAWRAALRPYVVSEPYTGIEPVAIVTNL